MGQGSTRKKRLGREASRLNWRNSRLEVPKDWKKQEREVSDV